MPAVPGHCLRQNIGKFGWTYADGRVGKGQQWRRREPWRIERIRLFLCFEHICCIHRGQFKPIDYRLRPPLAASRLCPAARRLAGRASDCGHIGRDPASAMQPTCPSAERNMQKLGVRVCAFIRLRRTDAVLRKKESSKGKSLWSFGCCEPL